MDTNYFFLFSIYKKTHQNYILDSLKIPVLNINYDTNNIKNWYSKTVMNLVLGFFFFFFSH